MEGCGVWCVFMRKKRESGSGVRDFGKERGVPLSEVGSGSEALMDLRRERFCQGIASGADALELYYVLWKDEAGLPRSKYTTAMSQKSKILSEPLVAARLRVLRGENALCAKLSREEKVRITEEVILGLREDFRQGLRGKTVNDLLCALQRHDAMTGDVEKPTLKIELGLGDLLKNVDSLVEERQKKLMDEREAALEASNGAKPVKAEVLDV